MDLELLTLFLHIVEKNGLAVAGREMGLSPASVSEKLNQIEKHYGVALLKRTTRAISLTEEGRILVEGARKLLTEAQELDGHIRNSATRLSGLVRISIPNDLGHFRLLPIINEFLEVNSDVGVDINLTDAYVDLVSQGIDFAVRYGCLPSSTLKSRQLGLSRRVICASPAYIENHGKPSTPQELSEHECILMRFGQHVDNIWSFKVDQEIQKILVRGRRIVSDGILARELCRQGYGIAYKSFWDIEKDLATGALVELLASYSNEELAVQIVYADTETQPRRVRALMDYIIQKF